MFRTGDIILAAKDSWLVKIQRFFNRKHKDEINWGHAAGFINQNTIVEMHWTCRKVDVFQFVEKYKYIKVIRYKYLTEENEIKINKKANAMIGIKYGYWRLFLQLLDQIFCTNFFTNLDSTKKDQVCSSLWAWIYWCTTKIKFNNVNWQSCEPDDIEDEQFKHPEQWTVMMEITKDI